MITNPSTPALLGIARHQLSTVVAPAVTDPAAGAVVAMLDLVLRTLEERSAHEIGWMVEEIEEIEHRADLFCEFGPDVGYVAEALAKLRAGKRTGYHLDEVVVEYNLAGEVLSRLVESSVKTGGPSYEQAVALLKRRMSHEEQIMGEFTLVAR